MDNMETYLDTSSAKEAFTAVKTYVDNRVTNLPEATTTTAGLMSASDKSRVLGTRFLGAHTLLSADWNDSSLSQTISVPGANAAESTIVITPKTRFDADVWMDYGVYYDDSYREANYMRFTCKESPLQDIQINISSFFSGV